jgi:hypothetical protein
MITDLTIPSFPPATGGEQWLCQAMIFDKRLNSKEIHKLREAETNKKVGEKMSYFPWKLV